MNLENTDSTRIISLVLALVKLGHLHFFYYENYCIVLKLFIKFYPYINYSKLRAPNHPTLHSI